MKTRYHLDANVVLRFLRNDDARQSAAADRVFAAAKRGEIRLALSSVTIAEIFYVLNRVYKLPRPDTAKRILPLIQSAVIEVEVRDRNIDACHRIAGTNTDFGDAYLAATAAEAGDLVSSFDRDMKKFTDVKTEIPK